MYEVRNAIISEVKEGLIWKPIELSEIKRLDGMSDVDKEKYVSHLVDNGVLRKIEHDKMACARGRVY